MWILPLAFFVSCKSNEGQWENKQISFPENIVFTKAGKDTIPFDFGKSKWKFFIYADIIDADNRIGRFIDRRGCHIQKRIMKFNPDNIPDDQYYTLPFDSIVRWNIREFGPFYIPGKNDSIPMNRTNYLLYKKIIAWEQSEEVLFQDGKVYLGNKELDGYRFKSNYYFMSGDNSMNSVDSRFWGLIPEDFIVGKAGFVITSRSRDTGKIRWNRVFKRIE